MMTKKAGGIHVGRPHTSKRDPKVHVTLTTRASNGKIIKKEHRSNLGAISIGEALFRSGSNNRKKR